MEATEVPAVVGKKPIGEFRFWDETRLGGWGINWHNIRKVMAIYISLVHVWALFGLMRVPSCQAKTLWLSFWLWPICGFGITGGAHRLWAHRSYKANAFYRTGVMLVQSIANQGSIFHWARDHRTHHYHSETEKDPHNAMRGFFYAHMGWLYLKKDKAVKLAGREVNIDDLYEDGPVMFQKRNDPWFSAFMCFIAPALLSMTWGETFWNGFFVPGALRYVWVLHMTWFVNSAAHLWGTHPYDEKSNPAENPWVAVGAIGEGWHNWHHKYPFDYAASEMGVIQQFNPTKMFIDSCAAIGMVTDRKRATAMWHRERAKKAQ